MLIIPRKNLNQNKKFPHKTKQILIIAPTIHAFRDLLMIVASLSALIHTKLNIIKNNNNKTPT